eukprot:416383-Prorocentrum_minimum.AAC.2
MWRVAIGAQRGRVCWRGGEVLKLAHVRTPLIKFAAAPPGAPPSLRLPVDLVFADQGTAAASWMQAQVSKLKRPRGEFKRPGGEFKLPRGEFKRPRGEFKRPRGEFKRPRGEFMNSSTRGVNLSA